MKINLSTSSEGVFVVALLAQAEQKGLHSVYLRNYENLPTSVENDVDLLIEPGTLAQWLKEIPKLAQHQGWTFVRAVVFSSTSLFFLPPKGSKLLHIDLNEQLEWHCVALTNTKEVLQRRRWNGQVFVPAVADELFLNVTTRLVYQGSIREKHREQWQQLRPKTSTEELVHSFSPRILRNLSRTMIASADCNDWDALVALRGKLRCVLLGTACVRHPFLLISRFFGYLLRGMRRLTNPPGLRLVFLHVEEPGWEEAIRSVQSVLASWGNLAEVRFCFPNDRNTFRFRLFRARNGVVVCLGHPGANLSRRCVTVDLSTISNKGTVQERSVGILMNVRSIVKDRLQHGGKLS